MAADEKQSSRNLLDEIEGGWDSEVKALDAAAERLAAGPQSKKTEEELRAELDAAAERLVDSLALADVNLEDLDSAWGDDDEEDDEPEEPEPELPDERLDPEAYAAAKKAREERAEARRVKKKLRAEAKKLKKKARAEALKRKQKTKKPRATNAPKTVEKAKAKAEARAERAAKDEARAKARAEAKANGDDDGDDAPVIARKKPPVGKAMKADAPGEKAVKEIPWRVVGIAVAVFLAAALLFAMLRK